MLGPALFPISLSNQVFSTEKVLPALPYIFTRHERVVFFVADHLQIYNKALRLAEGKSPAAARERPRRAQARVRPERCGNKRWRRRPKKAHSSPRRRRR